MKNIKVLCYTIVIFLSFMNVSMAASSPSGDQVMDGAYGSIKLPTEEERKQLQVFALKHGVDFYGILHELPDEDIKPWTKLLALSLRFSQFDKMALVYGYEVYVAFAYYITDSHGGEGKFEKLLDAQKPEVRQRIRDFLFYDAVMAGTDIHSQREELFRKVTPSVFPPSYRFGENDKLFSDLK